MRDNTMKLIFQVFTCNLFVEVVLEPQMDILAQEKQLLLLLLKTSCSEIKMGFDRRKRLAILSC